MATNRIPIDDLTAPVGQGASGRAVRVTLEVVAGPHSGRSWTLDRPSRLIIGRESPANIRLDQESRFSKTHCELTIDPPAVRLVDLGSTNGTLVNGIAVAEAVLANGDEFGIGSTRIRIRIENGAAPPIQIETPTAAVSHQDERLEETSDFVSLESGFANALEQWEEPPASLGAYDLEEKIGEGGMARVYKGRHRKTSQQVAIKLIRIGESPSEKMLQLFTREASVLLRLTHPRIVRSIEFGVQGRQPFLVLEWIPTIDLLVQVDAMEHRQRIRIACWIVSRILQALGYAHGQGIVHRDVKPANILAYREAHRLQVKLGDFGLAKCFGDAGLSAMTDDNSIRGTLAYMAPEQMRDSRSAGPPTDLFAAGACLYRLLTGVTPKVTHRGVECDDKVLAKSLLPSDLADIVRKAMSHEVRFRFESARHFANALQPFHGK